MLATKNISKKFSGVTALDKINLDLHPGKVNAIIGENGAGKSTLMKILSGVYTEYEGDIIYKGQPVKFSGTREAERAGIVIIHQELNLVPYLSIAENIFLGKELTHSLGILDTREMNRQATQLLRKLNLSINPSTKVAELRVGEQQLVEIAKALYLKASVIIMDEPTSAISEKEVENLFIIINELRQNQKTVVYISHKLKEVFTIADRFIVLRDGSVVSSGEMHTVSQDDLIQKMTGRKLLMEKRESVASKNQQLLSVKNLTLRHPVVKQTNLLSNISLELRKGEILGLYGLMGAGRSELMEVIFGQHAHRVTGSIFVDGKPQKLRRPSDAIRAGIALVPEDRKRQGLLPDQSIRSNISVTVLDKLDKWGVMVDTKKESDLANGYINTLSIKVPSAHRAPKTLSGGNQQKVVLAKWLATHPRILLLDEPTRGIDIHAKSEIYSLMKSLADSGMGIIMVSSELPEILAISDRVLVMCEGELTASIPIEEATEAKLLKYAIHKEDTRVPQ